MRCLILGIISSAVTVLVKVTESVDKKNENNSKIAKIAKRNLQKYAF